MSQKVLHRDHPEEVFRNKDDRQDFDDGYVAGQSRIRQFEVHKPFHETEPEVFVHFASIGFTVPEKSDDCSLIILYPSRSPQSFERRGWENEDGIYHTMKADSMCSA
jgi:hypothetical protein